MMTNKNMKVNSNHLASLDELSFAIEVGEDIQIILNNTEWYIGYDQNGKRVIAQNPNGPVHYLDDSVDAVLDFVINGKSIRDQWRNIIVVAL